MLYNKVYGCNADFNLTHHPNSNKNVWESDSDLKCLDLISKVRVLIIPVTNTSTKFATIKKTTQ